MICTVHQPVFLPYLGIIQKIMEADVLVLLDDVMFSKSGFVHRNKILKNGEASWVTVPVSHQGDSDLICDLGIAYGKQYNKMVTAIESQYRHAPYFEEVWSWLKPILTHKYDTVSQLNIATMLGTLRYLGIVKKIMMSSALEGKPTDATERNLWLTEKAGCDTYLSGANGPVYMDMETIDKSSVNVTYQKYALKQYPQIGLADGVDFVPFLSIVDYMMNVGSNTSLI